MGLKLKIVSSETNNLAIIPTYSGIGGVADFDDNMNVVFSMETNNPSIQYGKRLEWKMWIDAETGYAADGDVLFAMIGNSSFEDQIRMVLDGSLLKMGSQYSNGLFYPLEGLSNRILNCAVEKSYRTINSFSINGEVQTPIYSGNWAVGGRGGICLAYGNLSDLHDATLWDVKIYDTSTAGSPLIHSWKGYPAGNTDAAWIDDASTLDGDLQGTGGTRDIMGQSGSVIGSILLIREAD